MQLSCIHQIFVIAHNKKYLSTKSAEAQIPLRSLCNKVRNKDTNHESPRHKSSPTFMICVRDKVHKLRRRLSPCIVTG